MQSNLSNIVSEPVDPLIGTIVANRFKVLSLIGRGGMSSVYKAEYLEVDITVALKIMDSSYSDDRETLERFKREANILNTLIHPNLVAIYAFGVLSAGNAYLALEYIDGQTLASYIDDGVVIDWKECISIFKQICEALEYTHNAGIVHRDLKPSNVMLVDTPAGKNVRVLDFGIAQCKSQSKEQQQITKPGEVYGSPLYMSPEQCLGQPLDERSDIYSLGCVMYEALTGEPPFLGPNAMATLALHLHEKPQAFAKVAADRDIPLALERIVFKALEKKPEMRYQAVSAILTDFQHYEQAGIL
jgi:eukaryotic-like serine/threonine-protein kinase